MNRHVSRVRFFQDKVSYTRSTFHILGSSQHTPRREPASFHFLIDTGKNNLLTFIFALVDNQLGPNKASRRIRCLLKSSVGWSSSH